MIMTSKTDNSGIMFDFRSVIESWFLLILWSLKVVFKYVSKIDVKTGIYLTQFCKYVILFTLSQFTIYSFTIYYLFTNTYLNLNNLVYTKKVYSLSKLITIH